MIEEFRHVKMEEMIPGLLHVKFPSQKLLASTFLRFQEHSENPFFKGKVFTHKEFEDWYVSQKGKFDYYEEWDGFNLPESAFEPFLAGKFHPLTEEENALLNFIRDKRGKFYMIATVDSGSTATLKHEIAHGLFYLNDQYKESIQKVIRSIEADEISKHLKEVLMYHESVIEDELHAYILSELEYLEEKAGVEMEKYEGVHKLLDEIFNKHFKMEHYTRGR